MSQFLEGRGRAPGMKPLLCEGESQGVCGGGQGGSAGGVLGDAVERREPWTLHLAM